MRRATIASRETGVYFVSVHGLSNGHCSGTPGAGDERQWHGAAVSGHGLLADASATGQRGWVPVLIRSCAVLFTKPRSAPTIPTLLVGCAGAALGSGGERKALV